MYCGNDSSVFCFDFDLSPAGYSRIAKTTSSASTVSTASASAEESEVRSRLSHDYKQLLRLTWANDFHSMYNTGAAIYSEIFALKPEIIRLFPSFCQCQNDSWKETAAFRAQALRFVQVLSKVLGSLDRLEKECDVYLYGVGKSHVKYLSRGMSTEYWCVYETAMNRVMERQIQTHLELSESDRAKAAEGWKLLTAYVVRQIRRGFSQAYPEHKASMSH